jgi:hypothetical protein
MVSPILANYEVKESIFLPFFSYEACRLERSTCSGSFAGGANFDDAINLSNNDSDSVTPSLDVLDNSFYAVWIDRSSGELDVFYRRSTDGGATFEFNLSNLSGESAVSISFSRQSPSIAVS